MTFHPIFILQEKREKLNKIIWPAVADEIQERIKKSKADVFVIDAALLVGKLHSFKKIIITVAMFQKLDGKIPYDNYGRFLFHVQKPSNELLKEIA